MGEAKAAVSPPPVVSSLLRAGWVHRYKVHIGGYSVDSTEYTSRHTRIGYTYTGTQGCPPLHLINISELSKLSCKHRYINRDI